MLVLASAVWLLAGTVLGLNGTSTIWQNVRKDGRCGSSFPGPYGGPADCDPTVVGKECCSADGYCSNQCSCATCVDYRPYLDNPTFRDAQCLQQGSILKPATCNGAVWRRYPNTAPTSVDPILKVITRVTVDVCKARCEATKGCNGAVWTPPLCTLTTISQSNQIGRAAIGTSVFVFGRPINGGWSGWGGCMGAYGTGYQYRSCTYPRPQNGGANCQGPSGRVCVLPYRVPYCPYRRPGYRPRTRILLPLYASPDTDPTLGICTSPAWVYAARGCNLVTAIVNTDNGPGVPNSVRQRQMQTCMRMLTAHGVTIIGYVYTKRTIYNPSNGTWTQIGFRDIQLVQRDVNEWRRMAWGIGGFRGIFVDEVSNMWQVQSMEWRANHQQFYFNVINYIRYRLGRGALVAINPGGIPPISFTVPSSALPYPADITVVSETLYSEWNPPLGCLSTLWSKKNGAYPPGPYCGYVPREDGVDTFIQLARTGRLRSALASLVIRAPNIQTAGIAVLQAQRERNTYIYVTNRDLLMDPWANLSVYWYLFIQYLYSFPSARLGKPDGGSRVNVDDGNFNLTWNGGENVSGGHGDRFNHGIDRWADGRKKHGSPSFGSLKQAGNLKNSKGRTIIVGKRR
eukprot:comp14994_c0_seq1/m.11606 comp14994_c0_seq1/g.11606  ORF comp14994_c0_seq1/g.11606 comp14994_c0_seq1/m.11606 type:complete len:626 (-) comp14994_c0_seq1:85-1962(-)